MRSGADKQEGSGAPEYSSGMTREAVKSARVDLGELLKGEGLDAELAQLAELSDELGESERDQLAQIAELQALASAAGRDGGKAVSLPGKFTISVDDDQMAVRLSITPAVNGGPDVTAEQILAELRKRGLTARAQAKSIAAAVLKGEQGEAVRDAVIASGILPERGEDARLQYFGRPDTQAPLSELDDDDLMRQRDKPVLCKQNDRIMRLVPATAGSAGYKANGAKIEPPKPQTITAQPGQNVRAEENEFFAEIDGVVVFEGAHVEVRKCLVITRNLTRTSDPVKFDGDVQATGSVGDKATIEATGNIYVDGAVEAAHITSTGGDVVLRQGVAGKGRALIRAGRDIVAKYAENATLLAERDIRFAAGSMSCKLTAGHAILAEEGKGHLIGGSAVTDERVSVVRLGAKGGMRTDVRVGISAEAMRSIRELDQRSAHLAEQRTNCQEAIDQIELAVRDPSKLAGEELETYTHLRKLRLLCDYKLRKVESERQEVLDDANENASGRVQVKAEVAGQVHVSIGNQHIDLEPSRGTKTVRFDEANERVVVDRR